MKSSRLVTPVVLACAAISIFFGGAFYFWHPTEPSHDAPQSISVSETRLQGTEPTFDEDGRRVIVTGGVTLHIPESENPATTGITSQYPTVRLGTCWPREEGTAGCLGKGSENTILIWVTGLPQDLPNIEDGVEDLQNRLKSLEGPFDSGMVGIWEFRYPPSGKPQSYALINPTETGRHAIAFCASSPRCQVYTSIAKRLSVHYDFQKTNLALWPQIDEHVRHYLEALIVED